MPRRRSNWLESLGTRLDDWIAVVSPRTALRRRLARYALGIYRAGRVRRPRSSWSTDSGSPDEDILEDLDALRARSRQLIANSPFARAVLTTLNSRVVGSGLVPHATIDHEALGISEDKARDLEKRLDALWQRYHRHVDAEGRWTAYELQALVNWAEAESGDVFLVRQFRRENPGPLKTTWRVVEADRVATPPGKRRRQIPGGIETDNGGAPTHYWIKKTHPGDLRYGAAKQDDYKRVPARDGSGRPNILHLYHATRPGQRRGVPLLATSLQYFHDLDKAVEAELVALRVQACFGLAIAGPSPSAAASGATYDTESDSEGTRQLQRLEPGAIIYTGTEDQIVPITPTRPGNTFLPFVEGLLKAIGAQLRIPYEVLMLDFFRRSYSSARAALLEARENVYLPRRRWLVQRFCQPIWDAMVEEAVLTGDLPITVEEFYAARRVYTRALWTGPKFGWIDPDKEAKAIERMLGLGLTTWQHEAALQGHDLEDLVRQIRREEELRREAGLRPVATIGSKANAIPKRT